VEVRTADDRLLGRVELGLFPASLQVSPDGHYVYVVNFNLHGDMVPSSVSVVAAAEMLEVARLHDVHDAARLAVQPAGHAHYSTCMMDDVLVEIDTRTIEVARHFMLTPGASTAWTARPRRARTPARRTTAGTRRRAQDARPHGRPHRPTAPRVTSHAMPPTTSSRSMSSGGAAAPRFPPATACTIWRPRRRAAARRDEQARQVGVRLRRGERCRARADPDAAPVVHGVAISDDDRYAFISVEGIGSEPGTVEMIDLRTSVRWPAVSTSGGGSNG
jgi:DNA-binding beta-propeller fold protein YncE